MKRLHSIVVSDYSVPLLSGHRWQERRRDCLVLLKKGEFHTTHRSDLHNRTTQRILENQSDFGARPRGNTIRDSE
jgi:hypothetical protein